MKGLEWRQVHSSVLWKLKWAKYRPFHCTLSTGRGGGVLEGTVMQKRDTPHVVQGDSSGGGSKDRPMQL